MIDYETFMEIDLRTGRIIEAEPIEGADKLLRVLVDIGETNPRQVVAGIAQHYDPKRIIGYQVVVVANLKPAKLFGVRSEGMILAAESEEGLRLVTLDEPMAPGSRVT